MPQLRAMLLLRPPPLRATLTRSCWSLVRPRSRCPPAAGGKGFGKNSGSAPESYRMQDAIKEVRQQQLQVTEMMALLLKAPDPLTCAQQHVHSLNEEFFFTANTYLSMVSDQGAGGPLPARSGLLILHAGMRHPRLMLVVLQQPGLSPLIQCFIHSSRRARRATLRSWKTCR